MAGYTTAKAGEHLCQTIERAADEPRYAASFIASGAQRELDCGRSRPLGIAPRCGAWAPSRPLNRVRHSRLVREQSAGQNICGCFDSSDLPVGPLGTKVEILRCRQVVLALSGPFGDIVRMRELKPCAEV